MSDGNTANINVIVRSAVVGQRDGYTAVEPENAGSRGRALGVQCRVVLAVKPIVDEVHGSQASHAVKQTQSIVMNTCIVDCWVRNLLSVVMTVLFHTLG